VEYHRRGSCRRAAVRSQRAVSIRVKLRPFVPVLSVALLTLLSACSGRPPPLGSGLPKTFGPSKYFDTRLKDRFPIGSDVAGLLAELRDEGFVVKGGPEPDQASARYETHGLVCRESWAVHWRAEQGKLVAIGGSHDQACL
jgi:hypothetical protein